MMKSDCFVVKFVSPDETKPLRHKVLWAHIDNEEDCVIDIDDQKDAFHLAVLEQGKIISVASFFKSTSGKINYSSQYRLRAMATDPNHRGIGAANTLLKFAIVHLQSINADVLWCDAREVAIKFYSKLGFHQKGEYYEVTNVGIHRFMFLELLTQRH